MIEPVIPFLLQQPTQQMNPMLPSLSISLKSEVKSILKVLQKRKEIQGIPQLKYQSNFEVVLDAFKVRVKPQALPTSINLNREDCRATLLAVIEAAF